MKEFGIDISKWQGDFNFDAAIDEGVKFAIIKGGGGDDGLYVDSKFERNYTEAKKRNLPVGVYWFSKALTVVDAEKEADYFLENCLKGRQFELPIYIDVEHKSQLALGKRILTDIVKTWLCRLQSKGFWVGVYSSAYYYNTYLHDEELTGFAHWIAEWSTECSYKNTNCLGMWQFGGETNMIRTNKVAGQTCDQNYMLVDYPALIKAKGLNGFEKKTTNTAKPVEKPKVKQYKVHTVKKGESLWSIAQDYLGNGSRYPEIKKLNNLSSDVIGIGLELKIPNTSTSTITTKAEITEGSSVKLKPGAKDYNGGDLAPFVYDRTHIVSDISGDRVVITYQGTVVAAVKKSDLILI